jgi:hypothetical protein
LTAQARDLSLINVEQLGEKLLIDPHSLFHHESCGLAGAAKRQLHEATPPVNAAQVKALCKSVVLTGD